MHFKTEFIGKCNSTSSTTNLFISSMNVHLELVSDEIIFHKHHIFVTFPQYE